MATTQGDKKVYGNPSVHNGLKCPWTSKCLWKKCIVLRAATPEFLCAKCEVYRPTVPWNAELKGAKNLCAQCKHPWAIMANGASRWPPTTAAASRQELLQNLVFQLLLFCNALCCKLVTTDTKIVAPSISFLTSLTRFSIVRQSVKWFASMLELPEGEKWDLLPSPSWTSFWVHMSWWVGSNARWSLAKLKWVCTEYQSSSAPNNFQPAYFFQFHQS